MKTLSLLLLLSLFAADRCHADQVATASISLAGLPAVAIYVEPVAADLQDKGMTTFVFSVEVERLLKQAGVRVLNTEFEPAVEGNPTLYLSVTAVIDDYVEHCAYSIRLELTQTVSLERKPDTTIESVATWSTGGVGVYAKGWRQAMLDDVGNYTDQFIDAYLAVNSHKEN